MKDGPELGDELVHAGLQGGGRRQAGRVSRAHGQGSPAVAAKGGDEAALQVRPLRNKSISKPLN